jgi:hypothetical protein
VVKTSHAVEQSKLDGLKPFIGPIHFTRNSEHQKLFFGRDDETDEIVSLILGHRLILVYAQSGAGKTSIFEAQVAPTLIEKYGFEVLPRARVGVTSDTKIELTSINYDQMTSHEVNFFMLNAYQSLTSENTDIPPLFNKSLSEFLNSYFPAHKAETGRLVPQVLIFDQLEELFSFYRGKTLRKQQEYFFKQVAEALEKNSQLRIVFVIREDYLAELDRFVHLLPERLRPRFRLERLNEDAAFLAIKGPLERVVTGVYEYSKEELNKKIKEVVNNLSKIRVEEPSSDKGKVKSVYLDGEFVEPIQLQVVLQRRWKQLFSSKNIEDNQAQTRILADVDIALREFYEEAIHEIVHDKRSGISENTIQKLFKEKLITSSGTRALVHRGDIAKILLGSDNRRSFLHSRIFPKKG